MTLNLTVKVPPVFVISSKNFDASTSVKMEIAFLLIQLVIPDRCEVPAVILTITILNLKISTYKL